ncbi:MAG: hypothetical protein IJR18_02585 [Campylobacter sp.]|nr:hypothetical protein [Campylobacter sp.]
MKILNLASILSLQAPSLAKTYANDEILTLSANDDDAIEGEFIKCEIGAQGYVLAMLCAKFDEREYFANLDIGFLSGESNVGEEEIDEIYEFLNGCELVIIDENLLNSHNEAKNIESFLAILQEEFKFEIINLKNEKITPNLNELTELKELEIYDGAVVFKHDKDDKFIGGNYFCMVAKIANGDEVIIKTKNLEIRKKFELNANLKGTIALLGLDKFNGYNYEVAKISKVKNG